MAILMGAAIWEAATHTPLLLEFLLLSSAGHVTLLYPASEAGCSATFEAWLPEHQYSLFSC